MRVTIQDVATSAGVHKSTVARVLQNDPRINLETRHRLRALAQEMGYRPDPALSIIAAQRWNTRSRPSGSVLAYIVSQRRSQSHRPELAELRHAADQLG